MRIIERMTTTNNNDTKRTTRNNAHVVTSRTCQTMDEKTMTKKITKRELIDTLNAHRVANNETMVAQNVKMKNVELQNAIDEYVAREQTRVYTYAQIARAHDVNPKIARSKLRRNGVFATRNARHVDARRDSRLFELYVQIITSKLNDDERVELHALINDATNA